ncbi:T-cell surface antigen CD2 [Sturnira hondurensis]|uniref:T-cell surface antigen CD2 n=1 Tax=Sturnira hondurensis TaxID=192404 RepID=UPI0018792315|nr:T-cell surface antigen CD2 [Sturnira hondurensis]
MSLTCKILTSFLLIFILSTQGTDMPVQGVLNRNITLNVPDQQPGVLHDIRWFKNSTRIARVKEGQVYDLQEGYQVSASGALTIKHLQSDDSNFSIFIYNMDGEQIFTRTFHLKILEGVSKPEITWNCTNRTLTCKVTNGTEPKLELYQGHKYIKGGQKVIEYKWTTKQNTLFKCTATNIASKETSVADLTCPEKGLDTYLIIGICGGGILFLLFVALLILYADKRRKAHRRRRDEEVEIRAHRTASEERGQKPHQIPASALQNPATSQPPPPPSHRPKAHAHRPLPPSHRVQHPHQNQQLKRPLPPPGTQARQQKGPPLPRPRVQLKPPRGASENS